LIYIILFDMFFLRIKSEGLAHNSYFIGSGREAAVIDPRRDISVYLDAARENCMDIKYILETHRNEDYVVGSVPLSEATGATVYHGKVLDFKYGHQASEGDQFSVGNIRLMATETPGHTPESLTYAIYENGSKNPLMAFTGDTVFPGSTGRTDLWGDRAKAAGLLYDSIVKKILPLGDGVILCPAHGAGSVCGVGISDRDDTTIGYERLNNPDLQLDRDAFIAKKQAEPLDKPPYFERMEKMNLEGDRGTRDIAAVTPLNVRAFRDAIKNGIVFDARMPYAFAAHIPGSYSIWLEGLSTFPGWIAEYEKPIYLVPEKDSEVKKAATYLYRIGFDNVKGYLCGGFQPWLESAYDVEFMGLLVPDALAGMLSTGKIDVLDVRSDAEWKEGRIKEAKHIYVGELERRVNQIPKDRAVACICSSGKRASMAASILKRAGVKTVYNVLGGIEAWKKKDYPLVYERLLEK
jgi:hydroxyacylglutathione hydrolase